MFLVCFSLLLATDIAQCCTFFNVFGITYFCIKIKKILRGVLRIQKEPVYLHRFKRKAQKSKYSSVG